MNKNRLKSRYKFNFKVIVLVLCSLFITGIGFAYVQSSFSINGVLHIKNGAWNVYYDNITFDTNMERYESPILNDTKDTITLSLYLDTKIDYYEFGVDAINDGDYDAMISNVKFDLLPNELKDYIDYTLTYSDGSEVLNNDILKSKTRKRLKVKYSFKEGFKETNMTIKNYDITFKIPYIQATAAAVDRGA